MGSVFSCCYLCCMVCAPRTTISLDITECIVKNIEGHINNAIHTNLLWDLNNWSPRIIHDRKLKQKLTSKIVNALNQIITLKPYQMNGFTETYLSVNISFYLMNKLINPDHMFELCPNIPIDTIIYRKPKISIENITIFQVQMGTFLTKNIDINTNDPVEKKLLDMKLTNKLYNLVDSLGCEFDNIVLQIYNDYSNKINSDYELLQLEIEANGLQ